MSDQYANVVMMVGDFKEIIKVKMFLVTNNDDGTINQVDFSKVIETPKELIESNDWDNVEDWNYKNKGCKWVDKNGCSNPELNGLEFLTVNGTGLKVVKALSEKFPKVRFLLEYDLEGYHAVSNLVSIKNGELHGFYHRENEIDDKELKSLFPSAIC